MKLFQSARIKLTVYYLVIMAAVLVVFSAFAYRGFLFEIRRTLRARRPNEIINNVPPPMGMFTSPGEIDETNIQAYEEARSRVLITLVILNLCILALAGMGGYVLAGHTLAPIEEMVEEQKRFVSDASHELRTPLTSLKTEIEVALRDKKMNLALAKKLLGSNLEEVDKMQRLSNYLLALNKYQGGVIKQENSRVSLKASVNKAIERVKVLASKKEVKIESHLEEVKVFGNELSLTELAVILLDNAIKYSYKGGQVNIKVKNMGKFAALEVKDKGMGIKSSELPYIFNRFYRADSSRNKDKIDGYGLGLSIAKAITESLDGEIKVISKPREGSVFTVKFPQVS